MPSRLCDGSTFAGCCCWLYRPALDFLFGSVASETWAFVLAAPAASLRCPRSARSLREPLESHCGAGSGLDECGGPCYVIWAQTWLDSLDASQRFPYHPWQAAVYNKKSRAGPVFSLASSALQLH